VEVQFTSVIEELISHEGPKLSYGKQPMGNELFIQSHGLLTQQGFESVDIIVKDWETTKCFFSVSDKSALPFDIFSASFYLLTRYEEYLPHVKDEMGRFTATESLAFNEGFLQQPVVDIWAYKFKTLLQGYFPDQLFPKKELTIHNIVEAKKPFAYIQRGFFRSLISYSKDILKLRLRNVMNRTQAMLGVRRDPFDTFKWIMNVSKKSKAQLTMFFMLGEALLFEESLNTKRLRFRMLVKFIADYKEVGLIFSYKALQDYEILKNEKLRMEDITNRTLRSSINAQYLVNLPEIYRNLVELEVEKDFTMMYENEVGFRASTCTPYLFYDLDYEIKTPLIIHPIAINTTAFFKKYPSEINKTVNAIFTSVEKVNGTFSMLFSNRDFSSSERNKIWRTIFSEKLQKYE
tara:strand:- start:28061 stop:29275 length:1215 start_codon:yes stop_codon:yes gene_type:complete